jgi:hypothetical protein
VVLPPVSCSHGERHLPVSWCAGDRCDMADSDEDHGRSRRPSAEDRGWLITNQVLDGRTIERSGDIMCGLHHVRGDKECGFFG